MTLIFRYRYYSKLNTPCESLLLGMARAEPAPPSAAAPQLCSPVLPLLELPSEARAAIKKVVAGLHLPSFLSFPPLRGPSMAAAAFPGDPRRIRLALGRIRTLHRRICSSRASARRPARGGVQRQWPPRPIRQRPLPGGPEGRGCSGLGCAYGSSRGCARQGHIGGSAHPTWRGAAWQRHGMQGPASTVPWLACCPWWWRARRGHPCCARRRQVMTGMPVLIACTTIGAIRSAAVPRGLAKVLAKAWTTTFADAATSLEASFCPSLSLRAGCCM
jgi:hypothetical protein